MKKVLFRSLVGLPLVVGGAALGADIEAGKRLAEQRCAACHIISPAAARRGTLVADAPPFDVIALKFGGDTDRLALNLMGPHAKMNFRLSPPDAANIAEYIVSLRN